LILILVNSGWARPAVICCFAMLTRLKGRQGDSELDRDDHGTTRRQN
jgi:hypothetical protein